MTRPTLLLAVYARICIASARKALKYGPRSLRGDAGARAEEAMAALGLVAAPGIASAPPPTPKKDEHAA